MAAALGIDEAACDPAGLIAALDWERAYKTDYEIDCLRKANRTAARGHEAVRDGARNGASEFALHLDYLAATSQTDDGLPQHRPEDPRVGDDAGLQERAEDFDRTVGARIPSRC